MKNPALFAAVLATALMMGACGNRNQLPAPPHKAVSQPPSPPPPPNPAVVELEKRAQVERELRLKTEARLLEQESAKSRWQSGAMFAVCGAIVLLIVGAILGTRACHDSKI